ncbi:hypothetical protein KP509_15G035500 [Ceratopteris richardii]|uniref:Chaperonin-like RbcX protein n=1 Tax=Ceratopteris richardii TaxID=49495 RepID=A0A8T2T2E4_CERRI|nr:hypothetical protein KP509_15G035500 [Ceratopteris richardii]
MRCYTTSGGTSEPWAMVLASAASSSASSAPSSPSYPVASLSCSLPSRLCATSRRHCSRLRRCSSLQPVWDDGRARLLLGRKKKPSYVANSTCVPVKCDIGGQYEDSFADVDKHLIDYFTFKAVRTVLVQLYEMNPTQYNWFYRFVLEKNPQDGKYFLKSLVKERQELGERVMVTRLHLYNLWIKKYDHDTVCKAISDQNLALLRERLVQTVKWPSAEDDVSKS